MKTKIRTFIGLVALGMIGFTNINAANGNNISIDSVAIEAEKSLNLEAWIQTNDHRTTKTETKAETEVKTPSTENVKTLETETVVTDEDFLKAAESITTLGSDEEIEKYATRQIALENERQGK